MTTRHTPGPWHRMNIKKQGTCWAHVYSIDNTPIAHILPIHKDGERKSADFDIESANCALVSAAPEMLEALDYLQSMPNDPKAHRVALDAIKKARGE